MKKTILKIGRYTYLIYVLSAACCIAALTACSEPAEDLLRGSQAGDGSDSDLVEIMLEVPAAATRTSIDTDRPGVSTSVKWDDGDSFGLWIRSSYGEPLDDERFDAPVVFTHSYNGHDVNENLFSGLVPRMPSGVFGYYAIYPVPSAGDIDGDMVRCRIPSVQSGRYDDGADIMWAADELNDRFEQSVYNRLNLHFRHLTHALRITVPEANNDFGCDIERITIEFPQPVAGEMSVNLLDGMVDTAPLVNDIIEVRFDAGHPFRSGEPFWVFTAPVTLSGEVRFTAYNDTQNCMSTYVATTKFGQFEPNVVTPVSLSVTPAFKVTWFDYVIDYAQLGEPVDALTLKLPDGCGFADGRNEKKVAEVDGKFSFPFRSSDLDEGGVLRGRTMTATYESEHAIVPDTRVQLAISDYTLDVRNDKTAKAPYLFYEDFSGITKTVNSDDDLNLSSASASMGSDASHDFKDAGLNGWWGARCGAYTNGYVRILNRSQYAGAFGVMVPGIYHGRIDSPAMSNLKEGAGTKLQITFDYSMDRARSNSSEFIQHYFAVGTHSTVGGIKAESGTDCGLENSFASDIYLTEFSSSIDKTKTVVTTSECTYESRIAWEVYVKENIPRPSGLIAGNYHNYWLYLDNIRVTIIQ